MVDPIITVLMPVYNGGEYLIYSIQSILSQTYKNFELLIINDASTDNSLDIIRSFNDPRIRIHSNPVNLGQTKSLNVGLKLAKGTYIAINDADDLSLPQRLEKQIDFITKHSDVTVLGTSAYIMDKCGRIKRPFCKSTNAREIVLGILNDTPVIHGSVMMKKDVILSQGGYDENYRICQDYALWSSLIRKDLKIANIPKKMIVIRHYIDSISFKENEAQTHENGKIIYENVKAMTNLKITLEDAIKQRLFFAMPERLSKSDFQKMEELFVNEYKNLKNNLFNLNPNFVTQMLKSRMMKPFSKTAIAEFKNKNQKVARTIARNYIRNYGFSIIPFMIWIASYGNKYLLDVMFFCYKKWQELLTRFTASSGEHLC